MCFSLSTIWKREMKFRVVAPQEKMAHHSRRLHSVSSNREKRFKDSIDELISSLPLSDQLVCVETCKRTSDRLKCRVLPCCGATMHDVCIRKGFKDGLVCSSCTRNPFESPVDWAPRGHSVLQNSSSDLSTVREGTQATRPTSFVVNIPLKESSTRTATEEHNILLSLVYCARQLLRSDLTNPLIEVDDVCIVCLDEPLQQLRLPCGHHGHPTCLEAWFNIKRECPMCRRVIGRLESIKTLGITPDEVVAAMEQLILDKL